MDRDLVGIKGPALLCGGMPRAIIGQILADITSFLAG